MIYSVLASLNRLQPCTGPACEVMQCSTWYSPGCVRLESDSGWAGVPHWPLARQLGVNTRCCPANSITRSSPQLLTTCCCLLSAGWRNVWRDWLKADFSPGAANGGNIPASENYPRIKEQRWENWGGEDWGGRRQQQDWGNQSGLK